MFSSPKGAVSPLLCLSASPQCIHPSLTHRQAFSLHRHCHSVQPCIARSLSWSLSNITCTHSSVSHALGLSSFLTHRQAFSLHRHCHSVQPCIARSLSWSLSNITCTHSSVSHALGLSSFPFCLGVPECTLSLYIHASLTACFSTCISSSIHHSSSDQPSRKTYSYHSSLSSQLDCTVTSHIRVWVSPFALFLFSYAFYHPSTPPLSISLHSLFLPLSPFFPFPFFPSVFLSNSL